MWESGGHGNRDGGSLGGRSPPYTDAHVIAFLSKPVRAIVADPEDAAWLAKLECRIGLDVALIFKHVFDDDLERWARIYRIVDRGVGGLPLGQLSVDNILKIRQAGAQACEAEVIARSTP